MPQAVAIPAIGAAGSLFSGAMQSRAADKANRMQQQSQQQALAYEREKENYRRQQYEQERSDRLASRNQAYQDYQQRLLDWKLRHGYKWGIPEGALGGGGGGRPQQVQQQATLGNLMQGGV